MQSIFFHSKQKLVLLNLLHQNTYSLLQSTLLTFDYKECVWENWHCFWQPEKGSFLVLALISVWSFRARNVHSHTSSHCLHQAQFIGGKQVREVKPTQRAFIHFTQGTFTECLLIQARGIPPSSLTTGPPLPRLPRAVAPQKAGTMRLQLW